jgi:hypothetical protein
MTDTKKQHIEEVKAAKAKHKVFIQNTSAAKLSQANTVAAMARYVPRFNAWLGKLAEFK